MTEKGPLDDPAFAAAVEKWLIDEIIPKAIEEILGEVLRGYHNSLITSTRDPDQSQRDRLSP